jgi:5,10-methenyltetrahydromethanopterin hydrogenase
MGYVGTNVGNRIVAAYHLFNDTETATIDVEAGKTLVVNYTSDVKQGKLTIKIFNSADELVAELPSNTTGTQQIYTTSHEKYKLEITGDDTEGSFNVNWETQ